MKFGAGSTRTGLAHHPEVVLHVSVNDLQIGIATDGAEKPSPEIPSFLVEKAGIAFFGRIDRSVETLRRKSPADDDQFPCPLDGFFLKVIAEGPVPQHFEEGVVVGVIADILEVIVLTTGTDAFLGVGGAWRVKGSLFDA